MRVNQTETFAGTVTLTNGTSQTVQPNWQSDNTTVLTFETGGVARGRSNGTATIIGTNQGLTATRLIRVATDYQGTWLGEYVVRRCDASGDFRDIDFCDRDDGFYVGEVLEVAIIVQQDRDQVNGLMGLGSISGTTSGSVDANGRYVGTGSMTLNEEGVTVALAVNPLNVHADGDRMTGTFTVTMTAVGLTGQGVLDAELTTVVRTSSEFLPPSQSSTRSHSASAGGLKGVVKRLRR